MKRTLYLSMVCLLSAFSAVGQIGLRGLNPIEKQKLQLPELPASQSRVTLLRSSENVDYTQGVFILNEDWFGHNNSTINFMTSSGDFAYGEFYQFNLSSCIRQQNSLTAQFVSFSLSNLANIFYPPPIFTIINLCLL